MMRAASQGEPALKRDVRSNVQPSEVDVAPIGEPAVDVPETQVVHTRRIACDGGEGALGHPRVWMTIPSQGFVDCGYCDKRFVLAEGAGEH